MLISRKKAQIMLADSTHLRNKPWAVEIKLGALIVGKMKSGMFSKAAARGRRLQVEWQSGGGRGRRNPVLMPAERRREAGRSCSSIPAIFFCLHLSLSLCLPPPFCLSLSPLFSENIAGKLVVLPELSTYN